MTTANFDDDDDDGRGRGQHSQQQQQYQQHHHQQQQQQQQPTTAIHSNEGICHNKHRSITANNDQYRWYQQQCNDIMSQNIHLVREQPNSDATSNSEKISVFEQKPHYYRHNNEFDSPQKQHHLQQSRQNHLSNGGQTASKYDINNHDKSHNAESITRPHIIPRNQTFKSNSNNHHQNGLSKKGVNQETYSEQYDDDDDDVDDYDDESSEVTLAIASAEEYAAKIIKLQQACLIPLKEDLADWLNKILKTSNITTDNFMDKLDNGVIICRLAKIISIWCEQQLSSLNPTNDLRPVEVNRALDLDRQAPSARTEFGPLRSTTSKSTNCLVSCLSANNLNSSALSCHSNQFLNNLAVMHQTKIWEDAKCRTFYARDNVCSFIKWSKDFGVNQSVLFESDDLVLHANPRQVILCLLDVARIAYVKYGFTEAPGLVKFEQEIDKHTRRSNKSPIKHHDPDFIYSLNSNKTSDIQETDSSVINKKFSGRAKNSFDVPIDATDELVMRYCRHKEEEAARKRSEDLKLANASAEFDLSLQQVEQKIPENNTNTDPPELRTEQDPNIVVEEESIDQAKSPPALHEPVSQSLVNLCDLDSLIPDDDLRSPFNECAIVSSTTSCHDSKILLNDDTDTIVESRGTDSPDSGEGPTESASTGHSSQLQTRRESRSTTAIPIPRRRGTFTPSYTSHRNSSIANSELSSSRSSLLSNQEISSTSKYGRPIASDLDGKVMRIAKSYYGKKATKDITRLSEGKYKIADRIVFVRLLKGHRVMVRIGGGWDTLENFLFRHKSDPSQVIDPENLLPLESKIPFVGSPQVTPSKSISRLPYYKRSNSVSSTNLTLVKLSSPSSSTYKK